MKSFITIFRRQAGRSVPWQPLREEMLAREVQAGSKEPLSGIKDSAHQGRMPGCSWTPAMGEGRLSTMITLYP